MTKTDFDAKLSSLNRKITTNKSKYLLVENELKKLKAFDSSYFIGKSHFEEDDAQNYLVFQPLNKYFKVISSTNYVSSWKSKRLSDEIIKPPTTFDNSLTSAVSYYGTKTRVNFTGSSLKQPKTSYTYGKVVNIYIVYELNKLYSETNPTLVNCLFRAVSLTKIADIGKYKCSGHGIGFDRGVDMSSCVHVDNKGKDILILGKGPTQGLGEHLLTAEKMYSANFTDNGEKLCLILHYNGANSYLFVNGTEIVKFKAKNSEIVATPLCLGNISKDWSGDNMKDCGLNGYVYDFSIDYDAIVVDDIKDIHKYLMKKNNIV